MNGLGWRWRPFPGLAATALLVTSCAAPMVHSDPPGADAYMDGRLIGKTPCPLPKREENGTGALAVVLPDHEIESFRYTSGGSQIYFKLKPVREAVPHQPAGETGREL